jgi:hypothetical protein
MASHGRAGFHMARLEELTPGARITGLVPNGSVTVVVIRWHGNHAVTLTYRDSEGHPAERLLYQAGPDHGTADAPASLHGLNFFGTVIEPGRVCLAGGMGRR